MGIGKKGNCLCCARAGDDNYKHRQTHIVVEISNISTKFWTQNIILWLTQETNLFLHSSLEVVKLNNTHSCTFLKVDPKWFCTRK